MRFVTTIAAVLVVGTILAASVLVFIATEDSRDLRREIDERYDVDGHRRELEENGLYPGETPRILPGSLGAEIESLEPFTSGTEPVPVFRTSPVCA